MHSSRTFKECQISSYFQFNMQESEMNEKLRQNESTDDQVKMQMNEMKYVWACGFLIFAKLDECKILKY